MGKGRIVVWGIGERYRYFREMIFEQYNVVGLCENSTERNRTLDGLPIYLPDEIANIDFDYVLITPEYPASFIIYEQLTKEIGVDKKKILNKTIHSISDVDMYREEKMKTGFHDIDNLIYFICDGLVPEPPACDPFSLQYQNYVLGNYYKLSGCSNYQNTFEGEIVDVCKKFNPSPEDEKFIYSGCSDSLQDVLEHVKPQKNNRIIELGCGFGYQLNAFADICDDVTGIDVSPSMLTHTKKVLEYCNNTHAKLVQGDFKTIVDIPGEFDIIFMEACLHHYLDILGLLNVLQGKLAENGRLVICNEPISEIVKHPYNVNYISIEGIYQICCNKWMELIIRPDFFLKALKISNLEVRKKFKLPKTDHNYIIQKIR